MADEVWGIPSEIPACKPLTKEEVDKLNEKYAEEKEMKERLQKY